MNLERRINRLNRLLIVELGQQMPLAWISTNDVRLEHPAMVYESAEDKQGMPTRKPVYDYYCACGKNKTIHAAQCRSLSQALVRGEMQKVFPRHSDCWVLCAERPASGWEAAQLALAHRGGSTLWTPLGVDNLPLGYLLLPREPSTGDTWMAIRGLRDFRSKSNAYWRAYISEGLEAKEREARETARGIAREELGVSLHPGQKNSISFPAVEAEKYRGLSQ